MANVRNPSEDVGTEKKSPQQSDQWSSRSADQRNPADREYEREPKSPFRPESDPGREVPDVQADKGNLR